MSKISTKATSKLVVKTTQTELPPHRQKLVDMVIANLQKGQIPWHRGWSADDFPKNAITNKEYRGVNYLLLSMMPYSDNRWCTFLQAKEKGWKIKKGAKGTPVELYKHLDVRTGKEVDWDKIKAETAKMSVDEKREFFKKNIRTLLRTYIVFNGEQVDGIPERVINPMTEKQLATQSAKAENIIANSESKIYYNGMGKNYYRPSTDTIHLCNINTFETMQDYYATAFHEMAHSTGHESRLNRDMIAFFGTESYAKEELCVELASMFMQQDIGLTLSDEHIKNHSAYIQSWIKLFKDDPKELFNAVSQANKISKYVLGYETKTATCEIMLDETYE